ncbi:hypothetical protein PAV_4c02650 [Paenibacillus alvei DSM 29]|nr:hypothetical protein PAV_4c02650 [Paenibacillus alvei DSM 29]
MKLHVLCYPHVGLAIVLLTWSSPAFLSKLVGRHRDRPVCLLILALRIKHCQSFYCTNLTLDLSDFIAMIASRFSQSHIPYCRFLLLKRQL